jgi:hypothetical protein
VEIAGKGAVTLIGTDGSNKLATLAELKNQVTFHISEGDKVSHGDKDYTVKSVTDGYVVGWREVVEEDGKTTTKTRRKSIPPEKIERWNVGGEMGDKAWLKTVKEQKLSVERDGVRDDGWTVSGVENDEVSLMKQVGETGEDGTVFYDSKNISLSELRRMNRVLSVDEVSGVDDAQKEEERGVKEKDGYVVGQEVVIKRNDRRTVYKIVDFDVVAYRKDDRSPLEYKPRKDVLYELSAREGRLFDDVDLTGNKYQWGMVDSGKPGDVFLERDDKYEPGKKIRTAANIDDLKRWNPDGMKAIGTGEKVRVEDKALWSMFSLSGEVDTPGYDAVCLDDMPAGSNVVQVECTNTAGEAVSILLNKDFLDVRNPHRGIFDQGTKVNIGVIDGKLIEGIVKGEVVTDEPSFVVDQRHKAEVYDESDRDTVVQIVVPMRLVEKMGK